jgi:predicted nucleotidyltransferase
MLSKNEIIQTVQCVLEQHPYILRAEFFGSRQREDASSDSDVDLVVQFDPQTRPKGVEIYAVEQELEEALGLAVEVVQEKLLRPAVRQAIESERELVYEKVC